MLMPKRVKRRRVHRGSLAGRAHTPGDGYTVEFCGEKPVAVYKLSERQSRT